MSKKNQKDHKKGKFEYMKFDSNRENYKIFIDYVENLGLSSKYVWENYPLFVGELTLTRFIFLHELYKKVKNVAGHICEVGTYNGTAASYLGKLVSIYEPKSLTLVHTFDNFKGMQPNKKESKFIKKNGYKSDEKTVKQLVKLQNLGNIVKVHNLDVLFDLENFLEENSHIMFKMIFLDAGVQDVTEKAINALWPRLVTGGVLIFDQFSFELAPGETKSIRNLLPKQKIRSLTPNWMPNAYIVKE